MSIINRTVFAELKQSVGEDFISELIDTFLADAPKLIAELHTTLSIGNADGFRRAAHSLKSTSANFGATQFSALAKELEMLGRAGTLDGATDLLVRLEAAYPQVANELTQLVKG